ncbi:MAG TPA: dihydrodipicolinate synthase family protein, partial [Steroidobacteraceae bacterium]|nr:dihydrodipicolinate synthase family protein [Steroidobacteraceae bacterium]
ELIRIGARGVISVTANVAAGAMHQLCAAGLAGRHGEAMAINERLIPLHKALFIESNPIPVKWAVHRLGLIGPGIRLPLTPLSAPLHDSVAAAMAAAGVELR